jgi:putative SOS response-associated peptidase YedK
MCGNFSTLKEKRELKKLLEQSLDLPIEADEALPELPRLPLFPSMEGWVVSPQRQLTMAHWGLVPSWAKDASIARHTFNARSETLAEKPAFRSAYATGRCLVPATAWWEHDAQRRKTRVQSSDGQLLLFAGLEENGTFTIVTRPSAGLLEPLHARQPLLLAPAQAREWLAATTSSARLRELVQANDNAALELVVEPPKESSQLKLDL